MLKNKKIAVVGVACRFPGGVVSPDDYWNVLSSGQDVVSQVSPERFGTEFYQHPDRKEPGKSVTFSAGVLDDVDHFDAGFFGISPREAAQMDPQQRLLLELTWEALENGQQKPEQLAGSDCAVYVGIASTDYAHRRMDDVSSVDAYSMTGNTASIASNRISYIFDLQGPSVSVDTACSSSLVALHHACQAIRSGDASMAIAGGINMLLHPFAFIGFSKASMLSARGRCRTFDESGDGYVRSEGAAVLFLKPLEQAEADGDPIHAVIVDSGINCDGHTNGMTVPSSELQGKLLRSIYQQEGVDVDDLVYLEAHGTGTSIGDPLETSAIAEVLGKPRRQALPIGSAKTNVGHLETASGMAGFVKALLVLKHQAIPPSLHVENLNPRIDFEGGQLQVVTELTPLMPVADEQKRQLVGVNSFGFGGANAHVLIEAYHDDSRVSGEAENAEHIDDVCPPLCLSARSATGLQAMAAQYADNLSGDQPPACYDLAWNVLQQRQALTHGAVFKAEGRDELITALRAFADEGKQGAVANAQQVAAHTPLVWVFSGNGSQWQGMGQALLEESPVFRESVETVDRLLKSYTSLSLLNELAADEANSRLMETEVAQPVLFAFQVGMVNMLRAQGVTAQAVVGHSVGEVAAAWAAGALSLEQAVRVIYERSRAQGKTRGQGRMAAVGLSEAALRETLDILDLSDQVEIAGFNSPNALTVSAELAVLEQLGTELEAEGTFYRILDLDYAFHSHWMDAIQDDLQTALQDLVPKDTDSATYVSTVKGAVLAGTELGADYWWQNIRESVAFEAALNTLIDDGHQVFMEIGPHAILRSYVNDCLRAKETEGRVIPVGKRKQEKATRVEQAGFEAYLAGCDLDWSVFFPVAGQRLTLPNYPWQKERHWYPLTSEGYDLVNRRREHPLLGYRLKDAEAMWENQIDTATFPYLADHVVDGAVIVPAAAYVEMALAASASFYPVDSYALENVEIHAPIMLEDDQAKTVRFNLNPRDGSFTITSRTRLSEDAWTQNVVGRLTGEVLKSVAAIHVPDVEAVQAQSDETLSKIQHYELTEAVGLTYLPAFQAVEQVWAQGQQQVLAKLAQPIEIQAGNDPYADQYLLHPSLLDAGFQALVDVFRDDIRAGQLAALIPIQVGKLHFVGNANPVVYVQLIIRKRSPRSVVADFLLLDESGQVIAELLAARFRGMQFARANDKAPDSYRFTPMAKPLVKPDTPASALNHAAVLQAAADYWQAHEADLLREKHYQQIAPLFEVLATAIAWETVQRLCAEQQPSTVAALMVVHGIADDYLPLLTRLFTLLQEEDLVECDGVGQDAMWQLTDDADTVDLPPAHDIWLAILGDSPAHIPELVRAGRCGEYMLAVLRGEQDTAALLAPEKSSIRHHWLDSAPSSLAANVGLVAMVRQITAQYPTHKRLRILEIAGGQSTLTEQLLPLLPDGRFEYVFTDTDGDSAFQAASEFEDVPGFSALHMDQAWRGDEYTALVAQEAFDVLIAGDALHDWGHLEAVLPRIKRLMKPQGLLLLAQATSSRFLDVTEGLRPAWWVALADDSGYVAHLPDEQEWQAYLQAAGFHAEAPLYEPEAGEGVGTFLLLAQSDGECEAQTVSDVIADAGEAETHSPEPSVECAGEIDTPEKWLLLVSEHAREQAMAEQLQQSLAEKGAKVVIHTLSQFAPASIIDSANAVDHIVHLAGLAAPADDLMAVQEQRCFSTVDWVQALDQQHCAAKLWLVTANAMPAIDDVVGSDAGSAACSPEQAPLWGLGRVLMNEHPDQQTVLIDWQGTLDGEQLAAALLDEFNFADGEDEILLRADRRYVMRMQKTAMTPAANDLQDSVAQQKTAVCLDFTAPGPLKNLYWRALPAQALQDDEIEILPRATGLNFRDVMYAMGLLSDEAVENGFAGASLGMELSGTVVRVGAAVDDFNVGDAVIGFAPACFSTRVITQTTAVAHKPEVWSWEEAATIPTTFFTVYYALHQLAQLEEGERILIHGASGGVGLAAIQFARYRGAEVFALAGTDEKRDFVRMMGADHVLDSRSLKFADDVLHLTDGEGVDVVLNSTYGEAVNRNLSILKPFGRFLELGKRDFYENSKIGLRPFRNNITYYGIDADQLLIERPALAGRLFREMMDLFSEGVLRPLPHRVFPATRVQEAFRYMQQSRQIGKVIVAFDADAPMQPTFPEVPDVSLTLDKAGSYLVTGGLSGFGLVTARWLADKGAGTLVLMSRSGAKTEEVQQAIAELEAQGVKVVAYACDVADRDALQTVFDDMRATLPPLKGIVHAAMVLDDGIVRNLTAESFRKVLTPKMLGAWNLHELTANADAVSLDFFATYSSATTYLGNPGQANYVAANLYLEALMQMRRAQGLPGVFAAWGAIADAGYLARNEDIKDALQSRLGGEALTTECALQVLEQLLLSDTVGAAVIDFDWNTIQRVMPGAKSPKYAEQRRLAKSSGDGDQDMDIASLIEGLSPEEVQALIAEMLLAEVGEILRLPPEKLSVDKSVFDLGMDSLMGMELVLAIEERFGVRLPVMALTDGASVDRIAEKITVQLLPDSGVAAANDGHDVQQQTVADLAKKHGSEMSQEELDRLASELGEQDTKDTKELPGA